MGHYESCRINWDEEKKGCKSKKAKNEEHEFKCVTHGIVKCENCDKVIYTT